MSDSAATSEPEPRVRSWPRRIIRGVWKVAQAFGVFLILAWTLGALSIALVPWDGIRWVAGAVFAGFAIWAIWVKPTRKLRLILAGVVVSVFMGYLAIPPSHDREWAADVDRMPRAEIDGDRIRIKNFRNFDYRSRDDFDVRYDEREVLLSDLESIDFYISYWMPGPVGHTFLSFNFGNAEPVCISIETRPEVGEAYDPLASIFKGYELIYVVGDEHDLVGSRANHRDEEVYLYLLRGSGDEARRLFVEYLGRINELADEAEWYHLLKNNCTLNIIRYANRIGREGGFDIRHLLNGLIDGYLYDSGRIDTSLPFEELRRRSNVSDEAKEAAGADDFSDRIRKGLPGSSQ